MDRSMGQRVGRRMPSGRDKLAMGALAAGLAGLVLLTLGVGMTRIVSISPQAGGGLSAIESGKAVAAENARIKDFMERVALSHVASLRPEWLNALDPAAEPAGGSWASTSIPYLSRPQE